MSVADYSLGPPIWQSGDGRSTLHQGDSLELMAKIRPESVDCIWTDPPYFLSNGGATNFGGKRVSVNKGDWDHSHGWEEDHAFNTRWLSACWRVLRPAGTIWVTGTLHVYLSVGMAMRQLGFRILNDIVWEKPNPPPNLGRRCFTHSTEVLLWATKAPWGGRHKHTYNYEEMRAENGGKQMKTVWRFPAAGQAEKHFGKHPTQKPVALIDRCIRASTNPGDIVLDPFAGTAATGVAALMNGRHFLGIERDAAYVNIGAGRLSALPLKLPVASPPRNS